MREKKVAIFGAGASGLVSIKACLEEGLLPCCFEQSGRIGGVWNYTDDETEYDGLTVYENLVTNTSKCKTNFSDFPADAKDAPYLHNTRLMDYLQRYADRFELMKYIRFHTKVIHFSKSPSYNENGGWDVTLQKADGTTVVDTFDYMLLCVGNNSKPFFPQIDGQETSKIPKSHSFSFKKPEPFTGKTVLVVGNSHSAGDVACTLSSKAAKVYLSVGDGCWIVPHLSKAGQPIDMKFRRYQLIAPFSLVKKMVKSQCSARLDHYNYGLHPKRDPINTAAMFNSEISFKIANGFVEPVARVIKMEDTTFLLSDGRVIRDVDHVIYATGYYSNPMYRDVLNVPDGEPPQFPRLHRMIFPIDHEHHTVGFVGMIGGVPSLPIFELQARFAARVFSGGLPLPSRDIMVKELPKLQAMVILKSLLKYVFYVNQVQYCDMLAEDIGVYPSFWKLIFSKPRLAIQSYFGHNWPYQYRLLGPHSWPGAEQACLEAEENVYAGTRRGPVVHRKPYALLLFICTVVIGFVAIFMNK